MVDEFEKFEEPLVEYDLPDIYLWKKTIQKISHSDKVPVKKLVGEFQRAVKMAADYEAAFTNKVATRQPVAENFADGRNPQDKGDSKRHGINTKASVSSLRKTAKQGGRKGQLAHWLANMKSGRAKAKKK